MSVFESIVDAGFKQPYLAALNEWEAAFSTGEHKGAKITNWQRSLHAAKGLVLLVPLINIVAKALFDLLGSFSKDSNPSKKPPASFCRVAQVGNVKTVETQDLKIVVTTAKAEDGKHYAQVAITPIAPETEVEGSQAMDFVFCIDVSGSMDRGENGLTQLGEVKRVLIEFLDKAEETLKAFPQSQIKFSLVDFDTFARVVQDVTLLTLQNIPSIKETINRMVTRNTTNIPAGLALAANKMEEMARVRGAASRTFVFLTDGQNDREMTPHDLQRPQQQLNEASANLFALGMGQGHKAETMQFVIKDHLTGGAGNYPNAIYQWIDGSVAEEMPGKTSLSDAVQNIFLQANGRWMQNLTFESTTSRADVTVLNASKQGDRFLLGGVQFGGTAKKIIEVLSDDKELAFKVRYQVDGKTKEQTVQVELTNVQDRTILLEALKQDLAAIMTRIPRLPLNDQLELIEEAKKMITAFGDEENLKDYAQKFEKWGEDLRNPRTYETTSRSLTSYGGQLMSIAPDFSR